MLVLNCIGGYGGKAVFRPFRVMEAMYQKLIPLFDFLGPKLNFFSLTVCRSEQYLKNGSEKDRFAPIDSNAKLGPALPIAICRENGDAILK